MAEIELFVGQSRWTATVKDLLPLQVPAMQALTVDDVRGAVANALERPLRFEAFRRALTPDDRIALVVDESLPRLAELVAGVLEHLTTASVPPSAVTAVSPAGSAQDWLNELPDPFADLQVEVHQPSDRQRLSYLAQTKDGRRIYINRTVVDSDQVIVLSGRGYDPLMGRSGAETSVYPNLADVETSKGLVSRVSPQSVPSDAWPMAEEASEVSWLLGSPFFVQVIQGPADSVIEVVAGFKDAIVDGSHSHDRQWKANIAEPVETAIATLSGDPGLHDFAALARAAATAARCVRPGGRVIVLCEADPDLGMAVDLIRQCDEPPEAARLIFQKKPPDATAALQWAWAAERAKLFIYSEVRPTTIEEMFATPLTGPNEVQRMLDEAVGPVLVIRDAHKSWITVGS